MIYSPITYRPISLQNVKINLVKDTGSGDNSKRIL